MPHMSHIETCNTKPGSPVLIALVEALEVRTDVLPFEAERMEHGDYMIKSKQSCRIARYRSWKSCMKFFGQVDSL